MPPFAGIPPVMDAHEYLPVSLHNMSTTLGASQDIDGSSAVRESVIATQLAICNDEVAFLRK